MRLQRGAADRPLDDLRVEVVVDRCDLLGQPGQQEAEGEHAEERDGEPQHRPGQRRGDLPHLGVDEEERHEEQQHRQGAGDQAEQRAHLRERAHQRPACDRPDVEHLGGRDDAEHGQVGQQHRQGQVGVLPQRPPRRPPARGRTAPPRRPRSGAVAPARAAGGRGSRPPTPRPEPSSPAAASPRRTGHERSGGTATTSEPTNASASTTTERPCARSSTEIRRPSTKNGSPWRRNHCSVSAVARSCPSTVTTRATQGARRSAPGSGPRRRPSARAAGRCRRT